MCIVGVKLPRVLSRRAGRSRGRSPSDRPAARQHPREFDTNNTHTIMFDHDYSMITHLYCQNIQNNDATGLEKFCRKFTRSCSLILKLAIPVTGTTPQMALHVTAHILLAQACHTGWQHCAAVLRSYWL